MASRKKSAEAFGKIEKETRSVSLNEPAEESLGGRSVSLHATEREKLNEKDTMVGKKKKTAAAKKVIPVKGQGQTSPMRLRIDQSVSITLTKSQRNTTDGNEPFLVAVLDRRGSGSGGSSGTPTTGSGGSKSGGSGSGGHSGGSEREAMKSITARNIPVDTGHYEKMVLPDDRPARKAVQWYDAPPLSESSERSFVDMNSSTICEKTGQRKERGRCCRARSIVGYKGTKQRRLFLSIFFIAFVSLALICFCLAMGVHGYMTQESATPRIVNTAKATKSTVL